MEKTKKREFEIGQEVFYISYLEIKKTTIESIKLTENDVNYELRGHHGNQKKIIYKSKEEAQVDLDIMLARAKFRVDDIVLAKNKFGKVILGKINLISFQEEEVIYKVIDLDEDFYSNNHQFSENQLLKVKKKYIQEYGNVKVHFKELAELESKAIDVKINIDKIYRKLDEELKTSYQKHTSYFNFSKKKYEDRFVIREICDD